MYSRALFKVLPPPVAVIMLFYAFLQLAGASHPCDRSPLSVIDECGQLMVLSDLRPAAEFANRMVATLPTCVDSFQCAGIVAFTAGELNTAINMFSKAVELSPFSPTVRANLALARQNAGYLEFALVDYEAVMSMDPGSVQHAISLAEVYDGLDRATDAVRLRENILSQLESLPPSSRSSQAIDFEAEVRMALGKAYASEGRMSGAVKVLSEGAAKDPRLALPAALSHIPQMIQTEDEITESRARTMAAIDAFLSAYTSGIAKPIPPGDKVEAYCDMGYYLTYHGVNDEEFRRKIGYMHAYAYPHLVARAGHVSSPALTAASEATHTKEEYYRAATALMHDPPHLPRKLRVGIISAHVHLHSVSKMITRLIASLPRSLFTVILFAFSGPQDYVTSAIKMQVDRVHMIPSSKSKSEAERALIAIASEELDVIIYPEIGMHLGTYELALRRLAPVQISTHGNSETSGLLNSIDYFVSFDDIEAPLGHTHYSEQLVRLAGFHSQFTPPMHTASPGHNLSSRPQAEYTRAVSHADAVDSHLKQDDPFQGVSAAQTLRKAMGSVCGNGLETAMNESSSISNCSRPTLYLCPQTLYKLHPVFDAVIVDILLSDPCGRVLFLHGMTEAWDLIIVKRLADQVALKLGLIEKRYSLFSDQTACGALAAAQQHLERIIVGPQRGHNAFLGLLAAADVVVDSYPFGGCTSSYEALTQGTPVVTFPSDALRGRFTMALLKRLGLDHFVVSSLEQLAATAVEVGTYVSSLDWKDRHSMQADIATLARGRALLDETPVHEWTRLIIRATAAHWRWVADNDSP